MRCERCGVQFKSWLESAPILDAAIDQSHAIAEKNKASLLERHPKSALGFFRDGDPELSYAELCGETAAFHYLRGVVRSLAKSIRECPHDMIARPSLGDGPER